MPPPITAFPITVQNPLDTPISAAALGTYAYGEIKFVGIIVNSNLSCAIDLNDVLIAKGLFKVFQPNNVYDSDSDALAAGAVYGDFYVTSETTNHQSGVLVLRLLKV